MVPHEFENAKQLPALYFMIQDLMKDTMDANWFPWVKEPPPQRTTTVETATRKKPSWATRKSAQPMNQEPQDLRENGARVLVFVLGGATYSEVRVCDTLQKQEKRQVLMGSTHLWTPDSFVEALKDFNVRGGSTRFYGYKRPVARVRREFERGDSLPREGRSASAREGSRRERQEYRPRMDSRRGDSGRGESRGELRGDSRGDRGERGDSRSDRNDRGDSRPGSSRSESRTNTYTRRADSGDQEDRSPGSSRRPIPPPRRTASQDQTELEKNMAKVSVKDPEKKKRWFGF